MHAYKENILKPNNETPKYKLEPKRVVWFDNNQVCPISVDIINQAYIKSILFNKKPLVYTWDKLHDKSYHFNAHIETMGITQTQTSSIIDSWMLYKNH